MTGRASKPMRGTAASYQTAAPIKSHLQELQAKLLHRCDNGYVKRGVNHDGRELHSTIFTLKPCPICNPIVRGGPPHTHPARPAP